MTFVELYLRREEVKRQAEALRAEVAERQRAEAEVRRLNTELERRVAERTEQLRAEIGDRRRAEERMRVSLAEKEVLLREIHHRVKNNLQVIASLLRLQASHTTDASVLSVFRESQNRVHAMAMIHERLYRSESLAEVDFGGYVSRLASSLLRNYSVRPGTVKLETRVDPIALSIDTAIPLGLIVNELISNSLKHAFPDGREGTVGIGLALQGEDECVVSVRDNGVGFAAGVSIDNPKTLGLQVVQTLTDQLGGRLELHSDGGQTQVSVVFPLVHPARAKAPGAQGT
jgi:two-component sensor histidine kinase